MGSNIMAIATAVPGHQLDAAAALSHLRRFWPQLERLEEAEAALGTRYTCEPVDKLLRLRGLTALRNSYMEHATKLAVAAARKALEEAAIDAADVDMVVTVSCTGYLVPSLDVRLAGELGLRPDVLRLPITELGCSGGAAAVAFAHRHLLAFPAQKVLVIAVELPSLSFQSADGSLDNLTACLVFGDGAGAAVLGAGTESRGGLQLLRAASYLVPGTAELLGFDLLDDGFHVILDRRLPRVLRRELPAAVARFISAPELRSLDFFAAHAAGPRIFEAVESALRLPPGALDLSREVFAAVGNTSSAAIFFTLEKLIGTLGQTPVRGLGLGLGPGISIELMELSWTPLKHAGDEARPLAEGTTVGRRGFEETLLRSDAVEQDGRVNR
jgi:alkylresorcinol/alkylpyrone synthase